MPLARQRLRLSLRLRALQVDDRLLAGRIAGVLYLTGAASALAVLLLPGVPHEHWPLVVAIALAGGAWGLVCLLRVPWATAPSWVSHLSTSMGFPITIAVTAATGGATSPARFYLIFIVVYSAYFYPGRAWWLYASACALADAAPLLYEHGAATHAVAAEAVVIAPVYVVVGGAIASGKRLLVRLRRESARLAAEHGALRRVATAVAANRDPDAVYGLVAEELASLLGTPGAGILRLDGPEHGVLVGSWSDEPRRRFPVGHEVAVTPGSGLDTLVRTGRAVRVDELRGAITELGYCSALLAPVHVSGRLWGALTVVAQGTGAFSSDATGRLGDFADLLATAIGNTEDRAKLAAQAFTDPLTNLANHRAFHERLGEEVARAHRHARSLAVVLLDVDHFKRVNDAHGHEAGDRRLLEVADALRHAARAEDVLARIGGDEFAWLMPELNRREAFALVERAHARLSGTGLTISAGICDLELATDGEELLRLADGALYWSKRQGRDMTWIYDPAVMEELSAQDHADQVERTQTLLGLRALARAIDAKDPATRLHSERVAELVGRLAAAAGWPSGRVELLREAALVHDVGKVGVPDAILLKPGALEPEERRVIQGHAALGAQIVEDVLSAEQVAWVRCHHERWDGCGYPAGLRADEIPEGAALLAVADAWDVMTTSRSYSPPVSPEAALADCVRLAGAQFSPAAVTALRALAETGGLTPQPPSTTASATSRARSTSSATSVLASRNLPST